MAKGDVQAQAQAVVARPAQTQAEVLASAVATLDHDLTAKEEALANALAGSYPADYFRSVALSQFRRSPGLWDVVKTQQGRVSFVDAVVQAAQYGLPFLAGRAYLVPFKNHGTAEAQLIVGYQGLVDLVTAPGTGVTYVEAAVVYEKDVFAYERGTGAYLRHLPYGALDDSGVVDRGRPIAAWSRLVYATDQTRFDVMNVTEIEAIRKRSRAGQAGPWVTDWDPMACKTVLRRLCKTARISTRVMEFVEREDEWEGQAREVPAAATPQATLRRQIQARVAGAEPADDGPQAQEPPAMPAAPEPAAAAASAADAADAEFEPMDDSMLDLAGYPDEPEPAPAPSATAACGATVRHAGGTVHCSLARGHAGAHSDGLRDWPA